MKRQKQYQLSLWQWALAGLIIFAGFKWFPTVFTYMLFVCDSSLFTFPLLPCLASWPVGSLVMWLTRDQWKRKVKSAFQRCMFILVSGGVMGVFTFMLLVFVVCWLNSLLPLSPEYSRTAVVGRQTIKKEHVRRGPDYWEYTTTFRMLDNSRTYKIHSADYYVNFEPGDTVQMVCYDGLFTIPYVANIYYLHPRTKEVR